MKPSFRNSQPTASTFRWLQRRWLLVFFSTLILVLGISTTVVFAQSDSSLEKQENQLIQEYALPSAPAKPPVYKPQPPRPSKQQSEPAPQRKAAPAPQQRAAPAPQQRAAPQQSQAAPASPPPRRRNVAPQAESPPPVTRSPSRERQETSSAEDTLAESLPESQYVLQFNRSPVVGNRLRLQGVSAETRVGFTRPRSWEPKSVTAKALIRFQHSPALLANRSNLTVLVNGRSVGSVPLNRKNSEVGSVLFDIPKGLIQDYNDLSIVAQQNNDPKCSDPEDVTLWTEILPDSQVVFSYALQPLPLNFSRYPYPFFDELSLDPNRIVYLLPRLGDAWLTAAPRFQAALGRLADFRPTEISLVEDLNQVEWGDRLVVIGTPADQPALKSLDLPFTIQGNQILDGNQSALPEDVGILMLSTTLDGAVPVLVATGNGLEGVTKAVQFLVQPDTNKIGTGQAILVSNLTEVPTPPLHQWPRYLPIENSFQLKEIATQLNGQPFQDITVRGSNAPPIEFDFRALPDDRFKRGSSMKLVYSYGPQVNPRTSAVEVLLDGIFIGGARLNSENGAIRKTLKVDLPPALVKPDSKIQVAFRLNPREPEQCGNVTDEQLTGTVHADTSFKLNRETSIELPDLKLLRSGFPFAAPQDLSNTAIVLPNSSSNTDLLTLLTLSDRLGRLSRSESIKLATYTTDNLPSEISKTHHLVGIGNWENFPFQEAFTASGFSLGNASLRQSRQGSIQTLPDTEGVIKEVVSPDNRQLVILALTGQTDSGLDLVRQILSKDSWFFQLQEDTALISSNPQSLYSDESDAYKLEFLQNSSSTTRLENTTPLSKVSRFFQNNWLFLPLGILLIALLLYGVAQLSLKRITDRKSH
ncbi:cellulose biosynthesis cyclic di-GMP-binding regulatory protein BcsB [Lyngbya aestuarii]|uniref:cellulose biosynthesis cyclic di-GMP-binding regulatory protein BcsB n=1 Tax=Lyngbya aestuarii TaxID=118322 RepID=UPI00403D7646